MFNFLITNIVKIPIHRYIIDLIYFSWHVFYKKSLRI